jgi:hypothetical protein
MAAFPDAALGIRGGGGGGHGRWDWMSDLVAQRCPRMEARRNKREVGGGEEENVGRGEIATARLGWQSFLFFRPMQTQKRRLKQKDEIGF